MKKNKRFLQKKYILLSFLLVFMGTYVPLLGQCDGWSTAITTYGNTPMDMVVDVENSVYSIGIINDDTSIGGVNIDLNGLAEALYVVKHSEEGTLEWIQYLTGNFNTVRPSLSTYQDRLYFSVSFIGSTEWEGNVYTADTGLVSSLVVAMDLDGNEEWTQVINGLEGEDGVEGPHHTGGMINDSEGNLLITGRMGEVLDLAGTELNLNGEGTSGIYLAKFTIDGDLEWAKNSTLSTSARGWDIALDAEENILIGGYAAGSVQFDDNVFTNSQPGIAGVVAKFDDEGESIWVTGFPTDGISPVYGIEADEDNNIYIVGALSDGTLLGGDLTEVKGTNDAYVAKILPFGVLDWAQTFGAFQTGGDEWATGVNFTSDGTLVVTGQVDNDAIFGEDTLNVSLFSSLVTFLAEYTKEGDLLGLAATGGEYAQITYQSLMKDDYLYINGGFTMETYLGNDTLIADPANPDSLFNGAFVWKIDFSNGLVNVESAFDTLFIENSTYQLFNTGSSDYDHLTWTIQNGDAFSEITPLTYTFQDSATYACMTLSNCMDRETVCTEFADLNVVPIEEPDISVFDVSQAIENDPNGVPVLLDTICELRGIVYSQNFYSGTDEGLSFTLIDQTGGIQVYNPSETFNYAPSIGDSIHVIGRIEQLFGMTQIVIESVLLTSLNNDLKEPLFVESLGEETESELIEMNCLQLVDPNQWTNEGPYFEVEAVGLNGTIGLVIHENTDIYGSDPPQGPFDLVGIGIQNTDDFNLFDNYFIRPRSLDDLTVLPNISEEDLSFTGLAGYELAFAIDNPMEGVNYTWTNGTGIIGEGDTVVLNSPFPEPEITICLTGDNACVDTLVMTCESFSIGSGIESLSNPSLYDIFPNPISEIGTIALKQENAIIEDFYLLNPQGQKIKIPYTIESKSVQFEVAALPQGLYYFYIEDKQKEAYVGKFLVVK